MKIKRFFETGCAIALIGLPVVGQAAPPIWESNFGPVADVFTGKDEFVAFGDLNFSFPFDGIGYTRVYISTNGTLQLGSVGIDLDISFDHWSHLEKFLDDGAPSIAGFNSDLDLTTNGTIHVIDYGDRAVFTWNEVGTYEDNTALLTFQIILRDDGTIILGFNGILDDPGENLLDDLTDGIVIGVTAGDIPQPTDPGTVDFSAQPVVGGTTSYERWCCSIVANSCGFNGGGGLPGPTNDAFDLDQRNVVFTPVEGGFAVPEPASALLQGAALLTIVSLSFLRRSSRKQLPRR